MNNQDNTKNCIIENILSTELIHNPFDHKFVENVFPSKFYDELLLNIPNKSDFIPITETGTVGKSYSPERYIFNLLDKQLIAKIDEGKRKFFKNLLDILLSKELFTSVTSQFSKAIDDRLANFTSTEKEKLGTSNFKFTIRIALVKDFTKYALGAHTDTVNKFVTFLFYIPSDDSVSQVGTCLYEPKTTIEHDMHHSSEKTKEFFTKVKTCPFIPNSVLVFPRTQTSFHGVEEVNIEQKERNLLLLNYFFQT